MSLLFLGASDTGCLGTVGKGSAVVAELADHSSERAQATVAWWGCRETWVGVGNVSSWHSLTVLYLRG